MPCKDTACPYTCSAQNAALFVDLQLKAMYDFDLVYLHIISIPGIIKKCECLCEVFSCTLYVHCSYYFNIITKRCGKKVLVVLSISNYYAAIMSDDGFKLSIMIFLLYTVHLYCLTTLFKSTNVACSIIRDVPRFFFIKSKFLPLPR